jgi:hypothetical protein
MKYLWICLLFTTINGCASFPGREEEPAPTPQITGHPRVSIQGIDGTILRGRLLNATLTIDSGQGVLILLTDHIRTIEFGDSVDNVDSDEVIVSGKIKDQSFNLQNDHGVITLLTERLRKITFIDAPPPTTPAAPPHTPSSATRESNSRRYN